MATRSIATLSLSFGLVSIPVKVYSATASEAAVRFKLLAGDGARLRQQYVAEAPLLPEPRHEEERDERSRVIAAAGPAARPAAHASVSAAAGLAHDDVADDEHDESAPHAAAGRAPSNEGAVVERASMVKGYEFEKGRFVVFTPAELKALAEATRQTIDIVSFIPEHAVDPIYYDKAYYLVPAKGGAKPYALLREALRQSGRRALARWAWRAKEYVVEIRPEADGLVLQQLLYSDEVRSLDALAIEPADIGAAELKLALQLIAMNGDDVYDPTQFVDEEKQRVLAAIARKVAGEQVLAEPTDAAPSAQVIDLMAALRASLAAPLDGAVGRAPTDRSAEISGARKPVRRAARSPRKKSSSAKG